MYHTGLGFLALFLSYVAYIEASCRIYPLVDQWSPSGTLKVCGYPIGKKKMIYVEPDSTITVGCEKCTCHKEGLGCCGIGSFAGVMEMPVIEGCKSVRYQCYDILIKKKGSQRRKKWRHCDSGELVFKS